MIYRGYDIRVPFPPGSGKIEVLKGTEVVERFDYGTKDETIFDWIDARRRQQVAAGLKP